MILFSGYDCGVYAMCFAESVCAAELRGDEEERDNVEERMRATIGEETPGEWRKRIRKLILSLARK